MRLCQLCWKNLKSKPAQIIYKEKCKNSYLICDDCLKKQVIQDMINKDGYKVIYNTPSIKEMENN